jgi:hypothetical protein
MVAVNSHSVTGVKSPGIYRIDEDSLIWCWMFSAPAGHPRHDLLAFKRQRP